MLKDVVPMAPRRTLVTGCNGQLGHAVRTLAEERGVAKDFDFCDIDTFDMSDPEAYSGYDLVATTPSSTAAPTPWTGPRPPRAA